MLVSSCREVKYISTFPEMNRNCHQEEKKNVENASVIKTHVFLSVVPLSIFSQEKKFY